MQAATEIEIGAAKPGRGKPTFRVTPRDDGRWLLESWNARVGRWEPVEHLPSQQAAVDLVQELGGELAEEGTATC